MTAGNSGDDLLRSFVAQFNLDQLLYHPRATGEGVRIAVIDGGIDRRVIESRFAALADPIEPIEGAIFSASAPDPLPYLGEQSSPHGTAVADILLRLAPRAKLFSADVFGPSGASDVDTLVRAVRHAMDHWHCKIINLSLGISEDRLQPLPKRQKLLRLMEEAYYRDVLIFAAANNDHPVSKSYPSAFSLPLISVNKGAFSHPFGFAYHLSETIEFEAFAQSNFGPYGPEPATSWATPHLAGITAKLLSLRPSLKVFEIKTLLYWMTQLRDPSGIET
ncbi:S8 family peptidase [Tuwongella immobilis]|uniref:Peptidase S8/S53 domain-containing protein n=1 Tax=Tuwongella immobilis TaxID=692036 RepID=A0A6C2YMX4_9BACT|nr:S8 family serine peptidase [Tuwongella immobilis]VIP02960.1 serine protease : KerA OS=Streptomyces sp. C GN=SSNG_00998 PE=4 SV=1: Peptidase_S8 [Tuwongella immobilis]VTS02968.1 serine protease : KerA OS=Streptomyces sp. C GN=SSNG_00998 PE=4 SV=1: Peptidase_S8 [Tuwongella immobilis]